MWTHIWFGLEKSFNSHKNNLEMVRWWAWYIIELLIHSPLGCKWVGSIMFKYIPKKERMEWCKLQHCPWFLIHKLKLPSDEDIESWSHFCATANHLTPLMILNPTPHPYPSPFTCSKKFWPSHAIHYLYTLYIW